MLNQEQLHADRELVNKIDWSMTPEKAVDMYLEWGAGWTRGHDFVSSPNQESVYFVLFDWEQPPQATLLCRNMRGALEVAKVTVPESLFRQAVHEDGYRPGVGVHALNRELKEWLRQTISGPPLD